MGISNSLPLPKSGSATSPLPEAHGVIGPRGDGTRVRASAFSNEMLFERATAERFYGCAPEATGRFYDDDRGLVVRSDSGETPFFQDLIQFEPDALAFTGTGAPRPLPQMTHQVQKLDQGDWLHFCIRLGGRAVESIANYADISQPSRSCVVTRYPSGATIERISSPEGGWQTACLWLRPEAVLRFLETTAAKVPDHLSLLCDPGHIDTPRHFSLPLDGRMVSAVHQVLACPFTGGTRRAYIRSRYLEILALIYQAAVALPAEPDGIGLSISPCLAEAAARVAQRVTDRFDHMDSLDDLAREAGVSRTRLTQGFRALTGTSIEAYWQQARMDHARDCLSVHGLSVSEVALKLGYTEVASFSRAFTRAFGHSPSKLRATR